MNKGYHKKLPVSSIPLSRCSVILHTLFKLDFFLTFESRKENVELEQEGGWGATAAEEGWLFSPSGSNGGGDWWPRGAELCADMSSTPHPAEHSLTWGDSESTQTGE